MPTAGKWTDIDVADLQTAESKPELICVEIGRGLITKDSKSIIKSVFKFTGINRAPNYLFKDLCKCALLCSYVLWNARHEPLWTNKGSSSLHSIL